jgi:hypothetical protein
MTRFTKSALVCAVAAVCVAFSAPSIQAHMRGDRSSWS